MISSARRVVEALERLGGARRAPETPFPDISEMTPGEAAEALLRSHLDVVQRAQLDESTSFNVTGEKSGRLYTVEENGRVNNYCISGALNDQGALRGQGRPGWSRLELDEAAFCYGSMLAAKLLLETNEELFLYVADDDLTTFDWEKGPYATRD